MTLLDPQRRRRVRTLLTEILDRVPDDWVRRIRDQRVSALEQGAAPPWLDLAARIGRYRPLPVPEFRIHDHPDVRLTASDNLVTQMLYWYGAEGYEGAETRWWRAACERATSVLELGANAGYYTVQGALANPACRYRAVEPHPASADLVRRNLALNGITNVEVIEAAAVGDASVGRVELEVPEQDGYATPAGAFVRTGAEGVDHLVAGTRISVDTVGITTLVDDVDLLKIDIEGHEADVLEPIMPMLRERQPTIVIEVRRAAVPRLRTVLSDLAACGMTVFAIGDESLHLIPRSVLDAPDPLPRYGSRDLLLLPPGALNDF